MIPIGTLALAVACARTLHGRSAAAHANTPATPSSARRGRSMSSYPGIENLLDFRLVQANLRLSIGRRISRLVEMPTQHQMARFPALVAEGTRTAAFVIEPDRCRIELVCLQLAPLRGRLSIEHRRATIPSRKRTKQSVRGRGQCGRVREPRH